MYVVLQITQDVQSNPLRCDSAFHIIEFQKNLLESSVVPKPQFWFMLNTVTETQIGQYFRLIP